MSQPPIPLQLPLKGLNTVNPWVPWDSGYARELTNYSLYNGRIYMRPAIRSQVYNSGLGGNPVHWFDTTTVSSGTQAILADGAIRKLSDGSGATNIGGTPAYNATRCKHSTLDLVIGCREPRLAAYPFTAWTFTTIAITATAISCACSHKGRLYIASGTDVEYGQLAFITGAMEGQLPLAALMDGQNIIRMFSLSISTDNGVDNVLAIFGDGGKVLVYAGEYAGSPTWNLIGNFNMSPPVSNVALVEVDGDIWVSCFEYAYWFQDLFQGGPRAARENSPTLPIANLWQGVGWTRVVNRPEVSHAFYEPRLDAIVVMCSEKTTGPNNLGNIAEYQNEGIYFVYFRRYSAWAVWFAAPLFTPVLATGVSNTSVVYGTCYGAELSKIVHDYVVDQYSGSNDIPIESSWKTPFVTSGPNKKLNGVRPSYENTDCGYFEKIRAILDRSDYNSPLGWYTQSMVAAIDPGSFADVQFEETEATYNQYQPHVGIAGMGESFSLQFTQRMKSGTAAGQSQSIYGANCYFGAGSGL